MTTARRLWIGGWILAACATYVAVSGQRAFLPVYVAKWYLWLFALTVATYRAVTFRRDEELGFASFAVMYLAGLAGGYLLATLAPTIGERNYCAAVTWDPKLPPHVFRCTLAPFAFVGFLAGVWISGWVLMRFVDGIQSRSDD